MGIISASELGVNVPEIPNRKERRKRAKKAGLFKAPMKKRNAWHQVNHAANMQRDQAIHKMIDLANKKQNAQEKSGE